MKMMQRGKTWGGSPRGKRLKITDEQISQVVRLKKEGVKITAISRATGITRRHIYNILRDVEDGITKI